MKPAYQFLSFYDTRRSRVQFDNGEEASLLARQDLERVYVGFFAVQPNQGTAVTPEIPGVAAGSVLLPVDCIPVTLETGGSEWIIERHGPLVTQAWFGCRPAGAVIAVPAMIVLEVFLRRWPR